jgi:hypothetical protein
MFDHRLDRRRRKGRAVRVAVAGLKQLGRDLASLVVDAEAAA